MQEIIKPIAALDARDMSKAGAQTEKAKKQETIRIAIPLANGNLSTHFGHCERFALIEADTLAQKILKREDLEAPPHEPGLLPSLLAERGAQLVIAGGMGQRALGLFKERGITVLIGAPAEKAEQVVANYLAGTLQLGENVCDH